MVANLDAEARSNLVLPLSRHDLGICSGDFDAGVETGLVMQVSDLTAEADVATDRAVVGALLPGVAVLGPAKWLNVEFIFCREQRVFLLDSVPRLLFGACFKNGVGEVAEVRVGRDQVLEGRVLPHPGLS